MRHQQGTSQTVALVVISILVLASPALAGDCPELAGRWPYGPAYTVAVSGTTAYLGSGAVLLVLDVSSPAAPTVLADVYLQDVARGVAVAGSYAYVADFWGGLRVIDVSNPAAPFEVGSYDTPGWARGVAVAGSYVYVADGAAGLEVLTSCEGLLFQDSFESGDTSAWSATVP